MQEKNRTAHKMNRTVQLVQQHVAGSVNTSDIYSKRLVYALIVIYVNFFITIASVKIHKSHVSSWTNSTFCKAFDLDADSDDKRKKQYRRHHKQYNDHPPQI